MISVFTHKTELEVSQRKLEQMEKYNKIITYGRANLNWFCNHILKLNLTDYQVWIIMNTLTAQRACWVCSRGTGKSFLIGVYMMCRSLLFPNSKIYIAAPTSRQAKETFAKMEDIAKKRISSITGSSDVFVSEVTRAQANTDGFHKDSEQFYCSLFNGSQITSLVGVAKNVVGLRGSIIYDEAGKITRDFFALTEPFAIQSTDFTTGVDIDYSVIPKKLPNQCLYASSAEDVNSHLYEMYKTCGKYMMMGVKRYFACDINCEIPLNPTINGKEYAPLFNRSEVDTAMITNEYRALREYYNLFDTTGGIDCAVTRDVFIRNQKTYLPVLGNDGDPDKKYGLFYDPALQHDNSFILVGEFFRDPERGWMCRVVNGVNLIKTMPNGNKKILRSTEQIEWLRELMLAYNGAFDDYEKLHVFIDPGSGGGGRFYIDQLMPNWKDKKGVWHPGLVDMDDETSRGESYKFPSAKAGVLQMLNAQKWKTPMYDAAVEMLTQDLVIFPTPMPNTGRIEIDGKIKELTHEDIRAWAEMDLTQEEFLNIRKTKTEAGNVVYKLPPSKERVLKDDRAFTLAALCYYLSELRRKDKFDIKPPTSDFSVLYSNYSAPHLGGGNKQNKNPFAGLRNPFAGRKR